MTIILPEPTRTDRALVDIRGLDVGYVRHRQIRPAVVGLDLTVNEGEIVAIVGESGSGKTTTANAIIGLLPANGRITAGSAIVDGVETAGAKERKLRRLRGSVVGLDPAGPDGQPEPDQADRRPGRRGRPAARRHRTRDVDAEVLEFLARPASRTRSLACGSTRTSCPAACASAS